MPTIQQLPAATSVGNQDQLPLDQDGQTVSVTLGVLLASTQPAISIVSGSLLGRNSIGAGGPEQVSVGLGLALNSGTLDSDGLDHGSFAQQTTLTLTDEAILNSGGTPLRMQLPLLRGLFAAGENVNIDQNGTITATGNGLQGPPGAPGASITVGVGAPQGTPTVSGSSYVDAGTGNLYVAAGSDWALVGSIAGPAGRTGPAGPVGPAGAAGPMGQIGPAGAQGPVGLLGAAGPAGPVGMSGPAGAQGPAGASGPAGPAGPQGATGASGTSLLSGSGVPASSLGVDGDTFLDTATGDLYLRNGGLWSQSINIIGRPGATGSAGSDVTITGLPTTTALGAADLVGVSQGGTDHSITYADLLNGQTINEIQSAAAVEDTDTLLVGQGGSALLAQSFAAVWTWLSSKLADYRPPVAELTANTSLDVTTHNGRVLVCSLPLTLTAQPSAMGSGFACDVINASTGPVVLNAITSSTGVPSIAAGQSARVYSATYSAGTLVYAALGAATTAPLPGPVTGLAVGTTTAQSVTLTWTEPAAGVLEVAESSPGYSSASGYIIQYRLTGTSSWSQMAVTGTSGTVTGLYPSTTYDFTVVASNSAGLSPVSALVQATTLANVAPLPSQVLGLSVGAVTASTVTLGWTPVAGATAYVVQFSADEGTTWSTFATGVTNTSTVVSGLSAGTTYVFQVAASNASGVGPYSVAVNGSTSTASAALPSAVSGLAAGSATTTTISLSWAAATGATAYVVQFRTHGVAAWSTFAGSVTGTSVMVSGLTAATTYDFQVAGSNAAGTGLYGAAVTASTSGSSLAPPGAITGLTVGTATTTALPLTWTLPAGGGAIVAVTVQYRTPSGTGAWTTAISDLAASSTSYTVVGLTAATAYDVQVFASNAAGSGTAAVVAGTDTSAAGPISLNYDLTVFNNDLPQSTSYSLSNSGDSYMNCLVNTNSDGGGSYSLPAAVWFFTTQNLSAVPAVGATLTTSGGFEGSFVETYLSGASVARPATVGNWYVYAVAVNSGNVIGATVAGPVFTVTA